MNYDNEDAARREQASKDAVHVAKDRARALNALAQGNATPETKAKSYSKLEEQLADTISYTNKALGYKAKERVVSHLAYQVGGFLIAAGVLFSTVPLAIAAVGGSLRLAYLAWRWAL